MAKSTTFSAKQLRSSFPPDTKILRPRISFRVKKTNIENQYDLYYRTCAYDHTLLKELISLSRIHRWLESAPFASSLKLNLQKAKIFLS